MYSVDSDDDNINDINQINNKNNYVNKIKNLFGIKRSYSVAPQPSIEMETNTINSNISDISSTMTTQQSKENHLWDTLTTHHMLPVFAAAKAFVPTSFESLLVQVKHKIYNIFLYFISEI